jgi:hypothetical protein
MKSYPLKISEQLKSEAQRRAKLDGISLNQWIAVAIAEKIGSVNAMEYFHKRARNGNASKIIEILYAAPDRAADAGDELPHVYEKP